MVKSTLTERGQISVPASIRKALNLRPGQKVQFEAISSNEIRMTVGIMPPLGAKAMLGYSRKINPGKRRSTASWMKELRAGEQAR